MSDFHLCWGEGSPHQPNPHLKSKAVTKPSCTLMSSVTGMPAWLMGAIHWRVAPNCLQVGRDQGMLRRGHRLSLTILERLMRQAFDGCKGGG